MNNAIQKDEERPAPLRSVGTPQGTLTEQWSKLEVIEREFRSRIRRERSSIAEEHDRVWADIQSSYAQRIAEEIGRLEALRDSDLRDLTARTAEKMREHELLARRMSAGPWT